MKRALITGITGQDGSYLSEFLLKKGIYIYTGSAKKNIDSRIKRHLSNSKKLHWHIDYLLFPS